MGTRRCEMVPPCKAAARWTVRSGPAGADARACCSRHLPATCDAMLQGSARDLTVTRVTQ